MTLKHSAQLFAALATAFAFGNVANAQGEFAGTWTIAEWKVAPWVVPAKRSSTKPNNDVLNKTLTISSKGMVGPKILSCPTTKFEMVTSPYEGLFEGGLPQPKADGPALGFKAPVKTLRPSCDFDFHLREPNVVMFALDNVLYTMTKKAPAAK